MFKTLLYTLKKLISFKPKTVVSEEDFRLLSKNEQRVFIAKDVIARIKSGNFNMKNGSFIGKIGEGLSNSDIDKEFVNTQVCVVCAKGALACSWMGNFNRLKAGRFTYYDDGACNGEGTDILLDIFGRELFDAIECAFEARTNQVPKTSWHHEDVKAIRHTIEKTFYGDDKKAKTEDCYLLPLSHNFYDVDPNNIALAIFQNIIDNKGIMKLHDGTIIG